MPELPDLELFSANLRARLRGKKVAAVRAGAKGRLRTPLPRLAKAVTGKTLRDARREGKETRLVFTGGATLGVHLMLSGGFAVRPAREPVRHEVLSLEFADGEALTVFDPRGLASVTLDPAPPRAPDALEVDAAWLRARFAAKPSLQAKAFLIDQSLLRGIGNAYADEILWKARVHPKSRVGKIPPAKAAALARAIPAVLNAAVKSLRKLRPDALAGEERSFLAVHRRGGGTSPGGKPIRMETVAGKKTFFTDEQVLYG